jgi:hypothetical protein
MTCTVQRRGRDGLPADAPVGSAPNTTGAPPKTAGILTDLAGKAEALPRPTLARTQPPRNRVSPWLMGHHAKMSIDEASQGAIPAPNDRRRPSRRAALAIIPVAVLAAAGAGLGTARVLNPSEEPATPLGAVASLEGGLARIHGIIPLESSSWTPPTPVAGLEPPIADGGHRVRVIMELTAIEALGVRFNSVEFSVEEIAGFRADPLWVSHDSGVVPLGENLQVTFIFEIPNQAIQLVLEGPGRLRLGLGTAHHSNR